MDQNGVTVSINSILPTAGTDSPFREEVSPLCGTGILAEVWRVLLGSEGSSKVSDVHRLTERGVHAHRQLHPSQAPGLLPLCVLSPTASICLPSHHCQLPALQPQEWTHTIRGEALPFLPALSDTDPAPIAWGGIAAGALPDLEADPTGGATWGPGRPRCPSTISSKKGEREQSMGEVLNSWENRLFIATSLCIRGVFSKGVAKVLSSGLTFLSLKPLRIGKEDN